MSLRVKWRAAFWALTALVAIQPVDAQTVTGQLIDGLGRIPIHNAFIVLLDADGDEVARILTSAEGRFSLSAPEAGSYRLRSERIGFRAGMSEPFNLTVDGTHEMEMLVDPIVIRLDTIRVSDDAKRCKVVSEQGLETATVWEEARKALRNIAWSEASELFTFEIRIFTTYFESNGRRSHERENRVRRTSVTPFRNLAPEELHERGYVVEEDDEYYAPDPGVFFSEPFLQHHCFKLTRDNDREGQVGLEFEPVRGRGVPDIAGTLWIGEDDSGPTALELRYTGLRSHLRRRHASASVEFSQLPNGMWFVKRWMIRMPNIEVERPRIGGATRRREVLYGYEEDGREVLRVLNQRREVLYELEPSGASNRN